jgi:hypothetical protein
MRAADRVRAINYCAERLKDHDWVDIDFILTQFDCPTADQWESGDWTASEARFHYVRDMLGRGGVASESIAELRDYVAGELNSTALDDHPWADDAGFRIFLTHLAQFKFFATELKSSLSRYGVDAFVAHEDINPGKEWQEMMLVALRSCNSLVAILHHGFHASDWCDQEVGLAIGRGIPAVPLRIDLDPYGFLGAVQAVPASNAGAKDAARQVITILIRDKRTSSHLTDSIVSRLARASSFDQANLLSDFLATHSTSLTWDHIERLREARKINGELEGSFDFDSNLQKIEAALPQRKSESPPPAPTYDEDPF